MGTKDENDLRRALLTDDLGALPTWYLTLRIARLLNIPPWEVEAAPPEWVDRAVTAANAEQKVALSKARRDDARARRAEVLRVMG